MFRTGYQTPLTQLLHNSQKFLGAYVNNCIYNKYKNFKEISKKLYRYLGYEDYGSKITHACDLKYSTWRILARRKLNLNIAKL
ncbi:hypothetical protein RCL_jg15071.t1 [Rhizophagus clarus]|uniref:Uncharacterized protein n=1 Tax=Rhizophagus clarus TaxID=94130 RepID=A0A8H3M2M7_9GLOM|nr:hypothetical protein RCL_jg15071.t1 [Rhizophagus clarus]